MKQKIRLLIMFFRTFGIWNGTKLWGKFLVNKTEKIILPNIKHPILLRYKTTDIPTFYQVFLERQFEIPETKPLKLIIDAGANIGLFSVKMKNQYPEAKIICIEPDLENFQTMEKNIKFYDDIFLENKGLWHKDTKLNVYDKYNSGKWGMVVEEDCQNGKIEAISMNSLIKKYSIEYIDCLKIDIETSEKELFSANYSEWLPKVKMIIIELHDWMEDNCAKPFFEAINKTFKNYKYYINGENTIIINQDID